MAELRIDAVHTTSPAFAAHHGLEIPAPGSVHRLGGKRDGGAFGTVYPLEGTAASKPLLVKVFDDQSFEPPGAKALIPRLASLHQALETCPVEGWQETLLAVPFCLIAVTFAGERRTAALMLDLASHGFGPSPFLDKEGLKRYRGLEPSVRIEFALSFARAADLLEGLRFVHGDLNPENLMFDLARGRVQIIDVDSGAVAATGSERPLSPGKFGDCMPPEVKGTGLEALFDLDRYTTVAERWSVGSLTGRLLFGIHPGFFLLALGPRTLNAYAKDAHEWPAIDTGGPLFTKEGKNRAAYPAYRSRFEAAPGATRELFGRFFAAGLDGARRPRAAEWVKSLEDVRRPPGIEFVRVTPRAVVEGEEVVVSWAATNAERVESPDFGTAEPTGSRRLRAEQTRAFRLTAVNGYGTQEATSPVVRVVATPRLTGLPIAPFPRLRLEARVSTPIPPPAPRAYLPAPTLESVGVKPSPRLPLGRLAPPHTAPRLPSFSWLLDSGGGHGRHKGGRS